MTGSYRSLDTTAPDVFAYLRSDDRTRFLIVLNFGGEERRLDLSAAGEQAELVLSTQMMAPHRVGLSDLGLAPNEGLILRLLDER